jgi:hypothetical protein
MTTPTTPSDDLEAAARAATNALTPERREALMQTAECNWSQSGILRNLASGLLAYEAALSDVETERLADKARIAELEEERDDALDHVEELEGCQEVLSVEFEKECWVAVRALLQRVGWTDFSEGVTADAACEIIGDAIKETEARALSAEAAQARAEFLLAVMAAVCQGRGEANWDEYLAEREARMKANNREYAAEAALRASQEVLGKAVEGLQAIAASGAGYEITGGTDFSAGYAEARTDIAGVARQSLAQVEGGGEDKGAIPGPRPDDLRASRGEGSGS